MSKFSLLVILSSATVFLAAGGHSLVPRRWYDPVCNVKGNISINTGQRIFHIPGQEDYEATVIRSEYGERWFCSEAEAREAGWRKASR
ncbi:hypothetical protein O8B93_22160 [Agrobacterium rhizogenes]|uniref:sunset domain-containing protein n=1 Tax=Rhizobium rhizogenes TaxID=359 RepID=UPI0022B6B01A|nr:hypothetical protein [Rhizobium rhizogenes]MCZ7450292.1 hypothetical protein [Rhizobium rhizogenes]